MASELEQYYAKVCWVLLVSARASSESLRSAVVREASGRSRNKLSMLLAEYGYADAESVATLNGVLRNRGMGFMKGFNVVKRESRGVRHFEVRCVLLVQRRAP